jgi:hypothetical protein
MEGCHHFFCCVAIKKEGPSPSLQHCNKTQRRRQQQQCYRRLFHCAATKKGRFVTFFTALQQKKEGSSPSLLHCNKKKATTTTASSSTSALVAAGSLQPIKFSFYLYVLLQS